MTARGPGNLKSLYWLAESVYGTTPNTQQQFGLKTKSCTFKIDPGQLIDYWPDDKHYAQAACVNTLMEAAFSVKGNALVNASGYDWRQPLLEGALGALGGTSALGELPSYSMIVEDSKGSNYGRFLFNGCKVNQLVMSVTKPGDEILFEAEIMAQYAALAGGSPPTAVTGLQSLTLGAQEAPPSSMVLQWAYPWTLTPNGVAPFTIFPKSWKMTVKNNLTRGPGSKTGADGSQYHLTQQLHEGVQEIELEAVLFVEDLTHISNMLANKKVDSLSTQIGGNTIALTNGNYIVGSDSWPELVQDVHEHTVKWRFTGVTVT